MLGKDSGTDMPGPLGREHGEERRARARRVGWAEKAEEGGVLGLFAFFFYF